MSQLFPSGGQSIGGSASASILPMSIPVNIGVEIGTEKSIETESRLVVARGWKEEEVRVGEFLLFISLQSMAFRYSSLN